MNNSDSSVVFHKNHRILSNITRFIQLFQVSGSVPYGRLINFLSKHSEYFLDQISLNYPLKHTHIENYKLILNWKKLSSNRNIQFTNELINKYVLLWHRSSLIWNENFHSSMSIVEEYYKLYFYSPDKHLRWSAKFVPRIHNLLEIEFFRNSDDIVFEFVEVYKNELDWENLCECRNFPWTISFINKYENKINWESLSRCGNLSIDVIDAFKDKLDWHWLSSFNHNNIKFSVDLIKKFKNYWLWGDLSDSLPFGSYDFLRFVVLIDTFKDNWSWYMLGRKENLPWSFDLIDKFFNDWLPVVQTDIIRWGDYTPPDWYVEYHSHFAYINYSSSGISSNEKLPWSIELIDRYIYKWDWYALSGNEKLPWSDELIERYADKLSWRRLSSNRSLPWSIELIERYANRWDWKDLSENRYLPWSASFILKYMDNWDKKRVTDNILEQCAYFFNKSFINEDLVEAFKDDWNWSRLSDVNLIYSDKLIDKYIDKWHWDRLSMNGSLPWSVKLIDRYIDKWDWSILSLNRNIKISWTAELIDRYIDKWAWRPSNLALPCSLDILINYEDRWCNQQFRWNTISCNKFIPWTDDILKKFEEKLDWSEIFKNGSIVWSFDMLEKFDEKFRTYYLDYHRDGGGYHGFWQTVFSQYLNDEIIITILDNIHDNKS